MAVFWNLLRNEKVLAGDKKATALEMDKVFALGLNETSTTDIPPEVQKLVSERSTARKEKNFELSDKLRAQIEELGYNVEDSGRETKVYKRKCSYSNPMAGLKKTMLAHLFFRFK